MPDADRSPDFSRDWDAAFAALPLEAPPADGWARLSAALDARAMAPGRLRIARQRKAWSAVAAVLLTAALVPPLLRDRDALPGVEPGTEAALTQTPRTPAQTGSSAADSIPAQTDPAPSAPLAAATVAPSRSEVAAAGEAAPKPARRTPKPRPTAPAPSLAPTTDAALALATVTTPKTSAEPADGAVDGAAAASATAAIATLQAESAQLEALVAYSRDDRVGSAAEAVMTAALDERVARIDASLAQAGLAPSQREALWRQRVDVLRELAGVETTRRWLVAQGERYDGTLVSIY